MKRLFKSALSIALVSALFVSCGSDDNSNDNGGGPNPTENIGQTLKKGQTLTLEKNKKYNLSTKLVVEDGAILNIEEGVEIIGTGGTSSYIAVAQGGQIFVKGTNTNPVVMTALEKKEEAGEV
ncbi:hypothetical protein QNH98_11235 [Myroides sp. mNGS23_01]|nr:hypothetical protein [Myroides sp. mNGS23_01]WHT37737.1 hypothetical protein QNH98_11235 [Myroides sp. mNGS23_01]